MNVLRKFWNWLTGHKENPVKLDFKKRPQVLTAVTITGPSPIYLGETGQWSVSDQSDQSGKPMSPALPVQGWRLTPTGVGSVSVGGMVTAPPVTAPESSVAIEVQIDGKWWA